MPPRYSPLTPEEFLLTYNSRNAADASLVHDEQRIPDAKFCKGSHVWYLRRDGPTKLDSFPATVTSGPLLLPADRRVRNTVIKEGETVWHIYSLKYMDRSDTSSETRTADAVAEQDLVIRNEPDEAVD